jgi:hypothetical protein
VTTDAQAALAAAALVMGSFLRSSSSPRLTAQQAQQWTIGPADAFFSWLQHGRPAPDERLIPNEDFKSPSAARTERVDPSAVLNAAGPTMSLRTVERHMLDPIQRTPSGKFACLCGQPWPCSQREATL